MSPPVPGSRRPLAVPTGPTVVRQTRLGWRIAQHGTVLSEVLAQPGPTHSVFDLLATACVVLHPDARDIALLGFGGGGTVAALRALGSRARVHGVDLDATGHDLLVACGAAWRHPLCWHSRDAIDWLRRTRRRFDVIIDDLSIPSPDASDVVKPDATWTELPARIIARLRPGGLALFNLLPPTSETWPRGLDRIRRHFPHARVVSLPEYHNRLLVARREPPLPPGLPPRLARGLARLGSRLRLEPVP